MAKSTFTNLVCENCQKVFGGKFVRARKTCSKECYDIVRNARSGRPKGTPHTDEWKRIMSIRNSGSANPFFGKAQSKETREKVSNSLRGLFGEQSRRWIKDRSRVKIGDRNLNDPLQKQWSLAVKERDNWECRISNSECSGKLESHHILGWKDHPELRYEVNNGITLCHFHHPRKRNDEERLSLYFQKIVAATAN